MVMGSGFFDDYDESGRFKYPGGIPTEEDNPKNKKNGGKKVADNENERIQNLSSSNPDDDKEKKKNGEKDIFKEFKVPLLKNGKPKLDKNGDTHWKMPVKMRIPCFRKQHRASRDQVRVCGLPRRCKFCATPVQCLDETGSAFLQS